MLVKTILTWRTIHMEKKFKGIFLAIGVIVSLAALAAVAYTVFKKYFKVTFECDGDCCNCEDECFCEEDVEPICCCEDGEDEECCCCAEEETCCDAE